ncbi:MAG: nodulation protein NfeD [Pseudomonadota bacterium]
MSTPFSPGMRSSVRAVAGLFVLLGAALGLTGALQSPPQPALESASDPAEVRTAPLTGPIGPATTAFITRAIGEAEAANAAAFVIEMDTPGGLDTAMRDINQAILGANIPVIVYVSPSGARAASAGAYITYASHLAAMAPGTSIGAATPVQMGGGGAEPASSPDEPDGAPEDGAENADPALRAAAGEETDSEARAPGNSEAMRNKAVNDAVAYFRSLAELRGRNADWAERAVRESISSSAAEALELGVVEIIARDLDDLLAQADGRTIELQSGEAVTLRLADAQIIAVEKSFAEEILLVITDPNIAFMLVNLGFIGLLVSFYNGLEPITGVAGLICLIVGFYALNTLPVNYAGAALILLGLGLLVAEAFFASSGLLALGGLVAFAVGALMLFDTNSAAFRLDWPMIAGVTAALGATIFFVVSYGVAAQARRVTTGDNELIGQTGEVLEWQGGRGYVLVHGERWMAKSKDAVAVGDTVKIMAVDNLTLKVRALKNGR